MTVEKQLTPYELTGGEVAIQKLVNRFYNYMDNFPEAVTIPNMHDQELEQAKRKLFKFLSGWLGGPDLYQQEFGHPMLRQLETNNPPILLVFLSLLKLSQSLRSLLCAS